MKKYIGAFIIAAFLVSVIFQKFLVPTDVFSYLPSFSLDNWQKPYNSLLADPLFQFEPWRIFTSNAIRHFQIPIWNPLNGGGVPFLASFQNAFFFPLTFVYFIVGPASLLFTAIVKVSVFSAFTFLFLRSLKIGKLGSILGSIVASSNYMILWIQWPQTNVYMFFPLLLLLSEKKLSKKIYFLSISLIYFLALLGGHPETLFNIFIFHILYILFKKRNLIFSTLSGFTFGLLLGSFQLFPFIEYLLNSYAFFQRGVHHQSVLPVLSLPFFVFPQLLGAPQYSIYKSLSQSTNYAEYAAGSVGLIAVIMLIVYVLKYRRNKIVWPSLILISLAFVFSYLLGYLNSLVKIPIISSNNNQRFIIFAGFFSSIPLAFTFEKLLNKKINLGKLRFLLIPALIFFGAALFIKSSSKEGVYLIYLSKYLLFVLITTLLFFLVLFSKIRFKKTLLILLLIVQVIIPNIFYNKLTNGSEYYPKNNFIKNLIANKDQRILQIGNLNLPPDLNMAYGLESAENYDAMDVRNYKIAFDRAFSIKNHLGLVDEVDYGSLKQFGIGMVIADYDINSKKINIQKGSGSRILLLKPQIIEIHGVGGQLIGVRIITATFNRLNSCQIDIEVIDKTSTKPIGRNSFDCKDVRDNMFYTIPFSGVTLTKDSFYQIVIRPINLSKDNSIALLGGSKPYLDVLLKEKNPNYVQLFNEKSVYVFNVKDAQKIVSNIQYKNIHQTPTEFLFLTDSKKDGFIDLKYTYYPGWAAQIDGSKVEIQGKNPFMRIDVPKGAHYLKIYYVPKTFILGLVISFVAFVLVLSFSIRMVLFSSKFVLLHSKYRKNSLAILSKKEFPQTISYMSFAVTAGIIVGISLIGLLPSNINVAYVTSINWLTLNNHSLILDYIKIGVLFLSISISIILTWLRLTLKKQ